MTRVSLLFVVAAMFMFAACGSGGGDGDPGIDTTPAKDVVEDIPGLDAKETGTVDAGQDDPGTGPSDVMDQGGGEDTSVPDAADPGVGDEGTQPDTGDWSANYGQSCPQQEKVGEFRLLIDDGIAGSWFQGHVSDAVETQGVLQPAGQEGDCVLMKPINPFCDPECPPGQVCNQDSECVPQPDRVDVGTLTINGLAVPVALEPDYQMGYSKYDFDGDAYEPGAEIELIASGKGEVEGFTLQGEGVKRLEVPYTEMDMSGDEPITFEWTPSGGPGAIFIEIDMTQHAVTPVNLYCEVEDTGAYTVPVSLTGPLVECVMQGIPIANIFRRTIDSTDISPGCVEFEVFSHVKVNLNIE